MSWLGINRGVGDWYTIYHQPLPVANGWAKQAPLFSSTNRPMGIWDIYGYGVFPLRAEPPPAPFYSDLTWWLRIAVLLLGIPMDMSSRRNPAKKNGKLIYIYTYIYIYNMIYV